MASHHTAFIQQPDIYVLLTERGRFFAFKCACDKSVPVLFPVKGRLVKWLAIPMQDFQTLFSLNSNAQILLLHHAKTFHIRR